VAYDVRVASLPLFRLKADPLAKWIGHTLSRPIHSPSRNTDSLQSFHSQAFSGVERFLGSGSLSREWIAFSGVDRP
jgi:hypothetical protein